MSGRCGSTRPPGYAEEPDRRYPSVYVIQGFTGHVTMWRNRSPFRQPFPETADQVFASGQAPPAILVYVDAWTSYGGSQFVDSPGTGRYHSYLCDEVVPWVDARYRTVADREHRAIMGKSSGGFGAMITPMLRPDLFGGAGHARRATPCTSSATCASSAQAVRALRGLRRRHLGAGGPTSGRASRSPSRLTAQLLGILGVAAAFSARDDGTVDLPFDPRTGVLRPEAWQRWLDWDPVRMAPRYADALRSMRSIWIDAGTRDDYFLDVGAEAFRAELRAIGVSGRCHPL